MEIVMATLLENWRNTAYGNGMNKQEQEALWQKYLYPVYQGRECVKDRYGYAEFYGCRLPGIHYY